MNRLSGYTELKLSDGTIIPLKFGIGAFELFAQEIGVKTIKEAQEAILPDFGGEGQPQTPDFAYLGRLRKLVYCAAKFVCLVENRPVDFNEWSAADWIEDSGLEGVLSALDLGPQPGEVDESKKKGKSKVKPNL